MVIQLKREKTRKNFEKNSRIEDVRFYTMFYIELYENKKPLENQGVNF
jgi:hypothetical protein